MLVPVDYPGWPGGASPPGISLMEAGKGPGDAKLQPVGGTPTAENTTAYAFDRL